MWNERTTENTKSFMNGKYCFESLRTQDPEGEREGFLKAIIMPHPLHYQQLGLCKYPGSEGMVEIIQNKESLCYCAIKHWNRCVCVYVCVYSFYQKVSHIAVSHFK